MKILHIDIKVLVLLLAVSPVLDLPVFAEQRPDAGTILRDIEKKKPPELPGKPGETKPGTEEKPVKPTDGKVAIKVSGFRIAGNTVFGEAVLLKLLADVVNTEMTLEEIDRAAQKIATYYRERGYLVYVFVPPQKVTDGVVTINVVEGRVEDVVPESCRIKDGKSRFPFIRAKRYMTKAQPAGKPANLDNLDRGMMLLNDLPGVSASSNLESGESPGSVRQVLKLGDTPLVTGGVEADNGGGRQSGEFRISAPVRLNNPFTLGDRISLSPLAAYDNNYTLRTIYVGAAYDVPLGYGGLAYDHKQLLNEANNAATSNKRINSVTASINADYLDGPHQRRL